MEKKTWLDVEAAALHDPILHMAVTLVHQGDYTHEEALIGAVLHFSKQAKRMMEYGMSSASEIRKAQDLENAEEDTLRRLQMRAMGDAMGVPMFYGVVSDEDDNSTTWQAPHSLQITEVGTDMSPDGLIRYRLAKPLSVVEGTTTRVRFDDAGRCFLDIIGPDGAFTPHQLAKIEE